MKVLLSAPRAGSSYCYELFHNHNLSLPNVKYIGVEEYFDPNVIPSLSIEDKIGFLNTERTRGVEYTFKHHINYLDDYYHAWFRDFYSEHDVFILKRRNTWEWFLSFLFQDCVKWSSAAIMKTDSTDDTVLQIKQNWVSYDHKKSLSQFFDIKSQLDSAIGTVIFYEDLNHASAKYLKLSSIVNYEAFFYNINTIKHDFNVYSR